MAVGLLLGVGSSLSAQTITISENFTGTTAPGWVFGGTASTNPYLTANTVDSPGTGWLRLTESLQNQSTYALYDTQIFSVNAQIDITIEYAFWNGHNNLLADGTGADGITFFLVDASKDASNFLPGAYGGSLGYAQKTIAGGGGVDRSGMPGGYLGFGFDNWGNFSGATEGRDGGLGTSIANGTTTGYPNRIAVRGPDDYDGNIATGWDFIAASTTLSSSMDFPTLTSRPDQTGADYRAFHLTLDANNQLTVQMKFGTSGSFSTAFTTDLSAFQRPDNFKIGFTAGTGNADETQEVRNVQVSMSPFQAGAYEWDNGAGNTAWGTGPGVANNNWFNSDALKNNLTPTPDSDILFANRPSSGPQTVNMSVDLAVRSLTFDTSYNYTLTGSGVFTLGNPGQVGLPSINVNDYNGAQAHHHINNNIIVVEDLRINNYSLSTLCLNGTVSFSAHTITVNGTGAVNFNNAISGSGDITKNGSGLLTINAASTGYSGNFILNAGQTVVTANNALGNTTGGTTVTDYASLTFRGGVNYTTAETVTISGNGWAFNGHDIGALYGDGGTNTFAGAVVLAANSSVGARDGTLKLTGVVSGGFSLTKVGYGVVELANSGNSYTGATIINAGVLRVTSSSNSLPGGFATGTPSGGNLQLSGGVLEIGVASTFTRDLGTGADQVQFTGDGGFSAFGGARAVSLSNGAALTWASTAGFLGNGQRLILSSAYSDNTVDFQNAIALNGAARTVIVDNGSAAVDAKLSGALTGTGASGLIKTGAGTLELTNAGNNYTGATVISGGALRISTSGALSTNSNLQLNGGVLELNNANYTQNLGTGANQVQFTSDGGFSAAGVDRTVSLSGGATLSWSTTSGFLANGQALILGSSSADKTLIFQNALNHNGTAQTIRVQNGSATIDAQLTGVLSNGSLTVTGSGVLTSTAANTLASTVTVSGAELRLSGNGTLNSITTLVVQNGGTFTLDNVATRNGQRLANGATISLSAGTLQLLGNTGTTTESAGAVTLGGNTDNIIIANSDGSTTVTLTLSSLTRSAGATVDFNRGGGGGTMGGGSNNPNIRIVSAPTLNDGILAYATVDNDSFATHSGANSSITAASGNSTNVNTATSANNLDLGASATLTNSSTINSLRLTTTETLTISATKTLNLESGGLLLQTGDAATISGGTLTAGGTSSLSQELIVLTAPSSTLTISSVLANNSGGGTVGITKANTGTLVLSGTTANTLTGNTTVNGGTLRLAKSDSVTALAGNISVGDFSGLDRLEIRANEQIANTAAVTLHGTDSANRATLDLGGFTETFATLTIDGNAVVDFGGGNVCTPAYLYLDDLIIAGGSTLLIKNWIEFTTFILVKNTSLNVTPELGRIQFEGYSEAAAWITYDSTWSMIAPVPEPSTYGAIFLAAGLGLVAYRRHRASKKAV